LTNTARRHLAAANGGPYVGPPFFLAFARNIEMPLPVLRRYAFSA